jgi:hypothetical protein
MVVPQQVVLITVVQVVLVEVTLYQVHQLFMQVAVEQPLVVLLL